MKRFAVPLFCLAISACTSVQQSTRVATPITAREFNSVASKYLDRPTTVSIENMSDGKNTLLISMTRYGGSVSQIRFEKSHVTSYIELTHKYIEWEAIARSRGDAITKDIGRAPTWANMGSGDLKYIFHSGNQNSHFLAITFCAVGTCLDDQAQYFDPRSANELIELLRKFQSGDIRQLDANSVYK